MPRIQSFSREEPEVIEVPKVVSGEILKELVIATQFESMEKALDYHGATIGDIANTVAYVLKYGESDKDKLHAARLASELRGVAKGKDSNTINFIISSKDGVSIDLANIFNPQRLG